MMNALWFATLAAVAPLEAPAEVHGVGQYETCVVEGTVLGWQPFDAVGGIERASLLLEDVTSTGCERSPSIVVVAGMTGPLQLALAPTLTLGARYRLPLAPTTQDGVHVLRLREPVEQVEGGVSGDIVLSGNNVPACRRDLSARWASDNIVIEMEPRARDGISVDAVRVALEDAAQRWRTPTCSSARIEVSLGAESDDWTLRADGRSTLAFIDEESSLFGELGLADGLGFTCWVCDDAGDIIEADVRLEGSRTAWSTSCTVDAFDIHATALHEFGHVLGIGHAPEPDAVMFGFTSARRLLSRRGLSLWDVQGVCQRYPCVDNDCGEFPTLDEGCPVGEGLCATCDESAQCGAESDLCLQSSDGGRCGRECSSSFPCPTGYQCSAVAGGSSQCVVSAAECPDQTWVGVACTADEQCGGEADRCLADGTCGATCFDGVSCRDDAECAVEVDDDGVVDDAQCTGDALPSPPRDDKGGRCSAAPPGAALWFVALLLWIRRSCR